KIKVARLVSKARAFRVGSQTKRIAARLHLQGEMARAVGGCAIANQYSNRRQQPAARSKKRSTYRDEVLARRGYKHNIKHSIGGERLVCDQRSLKSTSRWWRNADVIGA